MVTSSISKICRLSLLEVLIGVGLHACIYRDECACACECLRLYCVSQKKNIIGSDSEVEFVHQHTLVHLILFLTVEMP